jgi:hypothetical protein
MLSSAESAQTLSDDQLDVSAFDCPRETVSQLHLETEKHFSQYGHRHRLMDRGGDGAMFPRMPRTITRVKLPKTSLAIQSDKMDYQT